ncbi:MAG TPA: flagellar basal body-associated FliL family protein [Azospirillum sp.]
MRIVLRRGNGEPVSLSPPLIIAAILIGLAVLGGGGAAVVNSVGDRQSDPATRIGPKKNYAHLPEMSLAMGAGGKVMDLRVLIELDPKVDPKVADPYAARIADRLGDRIRQIEPERLSGADGAKLMKSTVTAVVDREIRPVKVRDILLERMVVR